MAGGFLVGKGGLIGLLQDNIDEDIWMVPCPQDARSVVDTLVANAVHHEAKVVFTNVSASWMQAVRVGWKVYWAGSGMVPVGVLPMPGEWMDMQVSDFSTMFWGGRSAVRDRRTVRDVIQGNVDVLSPVLFVTSGSGGVGKSTNSRLLCERAARMTVPAHDNVAAHPLRPVLVDANMRQPSQRKYLRAPDGVANISSWAPGKKIIDGMVQGARFTSVDGRNLNLSYDVVFGPPPGMDCTWDTYRRFIRQVQGTPYWDLLVVDMDHVTANGLSDGETCEGGLMVPMMRGGGNMLFLMNAGVQTEGDAETVLREAHRIGISRDSIGVSVVAPVGVDIPDEQSYERRFGRFGLWMGVDHRTPDSGENLMYGRNNWDDTGGDLMRERVLKWIMPGVGFDPKQYEPVPEKKGFFASLFGRG